MSKWKIDPVSLLITLTGAVLFLPFLGSVHLFDWDEINFAECAREMLVAKQYLLVTINYLPFWEKPPLFIWMQVLSMKLLGVCDYAARLPNALCGIATLVLLYHAGKTFKDKTFGILWCLAYAGSILPFFYFKSGIIDPWFNFFIFTGIYFFIRYGLKQRKILHGNVYKWLILSAMFVGLAVLTKGPVAIVVFLLSALVYRLSEKGERHFDLKHAGVYFLVLAVTGCSWFLTEIGTGHQNIIMEFIQYQVRLFRTDDAGHGGPFYFHFIVLLFGCFPASVFAIRGMFLKAGDDEKFNAVSRLMSILFWVVLLMFSVVKTKIIHYSSLCYYPLTFFAASLAYQLISGRAGHESWKKWISWGLGITGFIIGFAILMLPIVGMNKQSIIASGILKDPFAAANLQADVHWSYGDCLIGLFLIAAVTVSLYLFHRAKYKAAVITLFAATLLTTYSVLLFMVPKIEQYTQQAAVEFFEGLQGKDVYVATLGYKSYAQYFYSREQQLQNPNAAKTGWLLDSNIDKPAYFSCKITVAKEYQNDHPRIKELYRKNGFVFFARKPDPH